MKKAYVMIFVLVLCAIVGYSLGSSFYGDYEGNAFSKFNKNDIEKAYACNNKHFSNGKTISDKMEIVKGDYELLFSYLKQIRNAKKINENLKTIKEINVPEGSNGFGHLETVNFQMKDGKLVRIAADRNYLVIDYKYYKIDKELFSKICDELFRIELKYYNNTLDYMMIE